MRVLLFTIATIFACFGCGPKAQPTNTKPAGAQKPADGLRDTTDWKKMIDAAPEGKPLPEPKPPSGKVDPYDVD